jgi:AcrR family transcriptional regulator
MSGRTPAVQEATAQTTQADRPPRADARRNRARILEAAEAVFARRGPSASTQEIARRAGVGDGTLFRHFPTKEALLEAIILVHIERLAAEADARIAEADAAAAFFSFFAHAVAQSATKNALIDLLDRRAFDLEAADPALGAGLRQKIGTLVDRAQAVGAVRADIGLPEVLALLAGAGRAMEQAGDDRDVRGRTLGIIVDGLRPSLAQSRPVGR